MTATASTPPDECSDRDTASDHGPPPECQDANSQGSSVNGVGAVTFWKLWSGDVDDADEPTFEEENASERTDLDRYRGFSPVTDFFFHAPPEAAGTWNSNDHGDFSGGDRTKSVYPTGATLATASASVDSPESDPLAIRDAYVRMFSLGPSTLVHEGGSVERLVAPAGTVRVVSDFRVEKPQNYKPSSPDRGDTWYKYTGFSYSRNVTFSIDGTEQAVRTSDAPSFSYGGFVTGSSKTFEVTIQIEAEITEKEKDYVCKDYDNGSCVDEGWEDDWSTETLTVSTSQTTSESATVYGTPSASGRTFEYAESTDAGVIVNFDDAWASVELGDVELRSGWRFFTQSPDGWGQMVESTASDQTTTESSVRPLEVHAYTVNDTDVNTSVSDLDAEDYMNDLRVEGEVVAGTSDLPANVDLDAVDQHLAVRTYAVISRDTSRIDIEDGQVVGLVQGQRSSVSVDGPETVHPVMLSIASHSESGGTHTYVIELVDESGNPVQDGQLVFNGNSYEVTGGSVTVTVEDRGYALNIAYQPEEWSGDGPYYQSADTLVPLGSTGIPSPMELFTFGVMVFVWFIPLCLILVALDFFMGTRFFRDSLPSTMDAFRGIRDAIFGVNDD